MTDTDPKSVLDIYLIVIVFFAASLVLGDYGNRFYVYVVGVELHHRFIAGFIEPLLTKLLPAVIVLVILDRYNTSVDYVRTHPYRLALVGGLSVALFERALIIFQRDATLSLGFSLAAVMHVVNALLIAGLIFSTPEEEQDWVFNLKLVGVTVLAMGIHVWWNGWGVFWVAETF